MPKMGLMPMKLLEFCQEVIILKCKNFLTHPFVPLCTGPYKIYLSVGGKIFQKTNKRAAC